MTSEQRPLMRWDELIRRLPNDRPIVGVEVGVWRGDMSRKLLEALPNLTLHLVDRWTAKSQGKRLTGISKPDDSLRLVKAMARKFDPRAIIHHRSSLSASKLFDDFSLDFVFIDARHDYRSVRDDIAAWGFKVKGGGLICGHDYAPVQFPGCVQAVDEAFGCNVKLGSDYTWFVEVECVVPL